MVCMRQRASAGSGPRPLNVGDLFDFIDKQRTFADSERSWSVEVGGIETETFDLSVKNPNGGEEVAHRSPKAILDEIAALDKESAEVLAGIRRLL
jgi:type I restriction enzyme M protein